MLIASVVPDIVCRRAGASTPFWLALMPTALLVAGAMVVVRSERFRKLAGFFLALGALRFGWFVLVPLIEGNSTFQSYDHHLSWGAQMFVGRLLLVLGAFLMAATLLGSGIGRRDLFLCIGDLRAPAQPEPILWFRRAIPWTRFGTQLLVIFGVALPLFLFFSVHPDFSQASRLWILLPWCLATAALNAANEEFQFRSVLLARLRNVLPQKEALILTAAFFGLGHYFGQPSGFGGIILAGIAGWIWAKSMVETRGFAWAFFIHMVQDIVIFCFLALVSGT
jgi:membrane protease YdiL (CAAX protease family)